MRVESTSNQINPAFIRDESVNQIQQQQQQPASNQTGQTGKTEKSDNLSISQLASSINEAASQIKSAEQFRTEKVSQIKTQLETNSYNPGSKNVAEKMIARIGDFLKGASA